MAELTHSDVDTILRILDQMRDREVHLQIGELKIDVSPGRGAAADAAPNPPLSKVETAPSTQPASEAPTQSSVPAAIPPGHVAVRAPTMGIFFRAESPGAKPYAEVGDRVGADDIVGVFEVMKLFSSLTAGVDGTVRAFLVANETLVEQDQPLILIEPGRPGK
jgi:acetyl-CoA carboxylase biotin carboxyl carrier protein